MVTTTSAKSAAATVRAIFGDAVPAVPKDALAMLEQSPLRPRDPAALAAVRALVLEKASSELERLQKESYRFWDGTPASAVDARPLPAAMALRLQELTKPLDPVVTSARAKELFEVLANADDIPHDFVDEGCHQRAHVAAKRLEDAGVYSEKAFLRPDSGADLKIPSDKSPIGFTLGIFHTAPCVLVKGDDGESRRMVLDPSLFDGPVSVEEWAARMYPLGEGEAGKEELFFLPRFAFHLSDRYAPPTAWRKKDLEDAAAWSAAHKEVLASMKESGFHDHLVKWAAEVEGAAKSDADGGGGEGGDEGDA